MCDRYTSPDQAAIEREWQIGRHRNATPFRAMTYVPPSRGVPVIWQPDDCPAGELELMSARWGLIPHSWTGEKPPAKTHNAIFETAATNHLWQRPLRNARCIVPAAGWYAWPELEVADEPEEVMHRFYIQRRDRSLIGFAGMISWWVPPRATAPIVTFSILTAPAAPSIAHLDDRMPIALAESGHAFWLEPGMKDTGRALEILRDYAMDDFAFHRIAGVIGPIRPESFNPAWGSRSLPNESAIVF
jgi:putative SOS response-associated peptidase YedK